jgi:hypothetical protein
VSYRHSFAINRHLACLSRLRPGLVADKPLAQKHWHQILSLWHALTCALCHCHAETRDYDVLDHYTLCFCGMKRNICVYLWVHYNIVYLTHISWSSISNTALKHNRAASMLHCLITVKKSLRLLDLLSILVYTICTHNVHVCFTAEDDSLAALYSM